MTDGPQWTKNAMHRFRNLIAFARIAHALVQRLLVHPRGPKVA